MKSLRQYDVGVVLDLAVRDQDDQLVTLDGTETATLYLASPSGRVKSRAATVQAGTTSVSYATATLDLDEWGIWSVQAEIVSAAFDITTSIVLLDVDRVLRASTIVVDARPILILLVVPPPTLTL